MNVWGIGQEVRCSGTFTDELTGAPVDPATVTFTLVYVTVAGASTKTVYTYGIDTALVRSGVGAYYQIVDGTLAGDYYYSFDGYGTGQGAPANDGHFRVQSRNTRS